MKQNSFVNRISRGYRQCNVPLLANGMVYSTLIALIPCCAIVWFLFERLGLLDKFVVFLDQFLVGTFGSEMGAKLESYLELFTNNALGLGITGILSFLVTFLILIDKIWRAINTVFEGHNTSAPKRYRYYITYLVAGIVLTSVILYIRGRFSSWFIFLEKLPDINIFEKTLSFFVPYVVIFILIFLSYNFMHSGKAIPLSSLFGSVFSTVCIFILTKIFQVVVKFSVKNSVIYGSLASILFFLMFLSWVWQIILLGALFSHTLSSSHAFEEIDIEIIKKD